MTNAVLNSENVPGGVLLPSGEGGAQRRMRAFQIVERAALTRRLRGTLSQWERANYEKNPEPASNLSFSQKL
jgi:hypothetical protein